MTWHVALLRGVNVGGHKPVAMGDLREMLAALDFSDVQSVLQSGNLVFRAAGKGDALEARLEAEAKKQFGLETHFLVRSAKEWAEVVARNPFPKEAQDDPGRLVVIFLRVAPSPAAVKALRAAIVGREVVRAVGKHAYVYYPDGQGRSKLTFTILTRHLGAGATGRNWNTVLRLAALVSPA